jgi:TPR repeat protein
VPPAAVPPPEPASGLPVATAPAMPSASPPLPTELAELLARGDSFVLIGDVASARALYERAANARDGRAAVRMGATFDPVFLRRAGLRKTFGDPAQARSWYRRALDLGSVEARALVKGNP